MPDIRLSIIVPFLNSHEIVRRQILFMEKIGLNDFKDVEVIYMDDGSDPPLTSDTTLERFQIVPTHETRPWTSSLARNKGALIAKGEYLFFVDGDFIIPRKAVETALAFDGDRLGVRREFGVLDKDGILSQDPQVLLQWGILPQRITDRRFPRLAPHPNHYVMRKQLFFDLGAYNETIILEREYPQGEDNDLKKRWKRYLLAGKAKEPETDIRPVLYMFPSGQFNGDIDSNPFGFFHTLTRKTARNPWRGFRVKD